jgi:hypothetical protein
MSPRPDKTVLPADAMSPRPDEGILGELKGTHSAFAPKDLPRKAVTHA